jgi:nitrite reductase/ring-hydroxylating ferredoxin subunit
MRPAVRNVNPWAILRRGFEIPTVAARHCGAFAVLQISEKPAATSANRNKGTFMAEWFVAKSAEMADGDRRIVTAGSQEIGVFFKDGTFYAYSNYCLHSGGPACEGLLINRVVDLIAEDRTYQGQTFGDEMHFVCPWHGYEYELKTGECVGDRKRKLRKYVVVRRGDDVYVVA